MSQQFIKLLGPSVEVDLVEAILKQARQRQREIARLNPALYQAWSQATGLTAFFLSFYVAYMPNSDLVEVDASTFEAYAAHSARLFLNSRVPNLPFRIFLNDVAWYRINSEAILPCRAEFESELLAFLANEGIDIQRGIQSEEDYQEWILAVNRYAACEATYESTDVRTIDPRSLKRRVFGRCGEESTFLVTLLRSLGIPARQIYAPLWAHTDDNHAWVEAFTGQDFAFLGACEPEPCLNRAWFTDASSRSPLMLVRSILPYNDGHYLTRSNGLCLSNRGAFYANQRPVQVQVVEAGQPVAGAKVRFQLMNYAHRSTLLELTTDDRGQVKLHLGHCSFWLEAITENAYARTFVEQETFELSPLLLECQLQPQQSVLTETLQLEERHSYCALPSKKHHRVLTESERQERRELLDRCNQAREAKLERMAEQNAELNELAEMLVAKAESRLERLPACASLNLLLDADRRKAHLRLAYGNSNILLTFLRQNYLRQLDHGLRGLCLLLSLSEKRLADVSLSALQDALDSLPEGEAFFDFLSGFPSQVDWSCTLSPEVASEPWQAYRLTLKSLLPEVGNKGQSERLEAALGFVQAFFMAGNGSLPTTQPFHLSIRSLLTLRLAESNERLLVLTQALRLYGMAARLNLTLSCVDYFDGAQWQSLFLSEEKQQVAQACPQRGELRLNYEGSEAWSYYNNLTLARFNGQRYVLCEPELMDFGPNQAILLEEGHYELCSNLRLPNGHCKTRIWRFQLKPEEKVDIDFDFPSAEAEELLNPLRLDPCYVQQGDQAFSFPEALDKPTFLLWLEHWEEPSIHVLNELLEQSSAFRSSGLALKLILPLDELTQAKPFSPALEAVLKQFPEAELYYGEAEEQTARQLFINPELSPRGIYVDASKQSQYAFSGYQVGSISLLLRLHQLAKA